MTPKLGGHNPGGGGLSFRESSRDQAGKHSRKGLPEVPPQPRSWGPVSPSAHKSNWTWFLLTSTGKVSFGPLPRPLPLLGVSATPPAHCWPPSLPRSTGPGPQRLGLRRAPPSGRVDAVSALWATTTVDVCHRAPVQAHGVCQSKGEPYYMLRTLDDGSVSTGLHQPLFLTKYGTTLRRTARRHVRNLCTVPSILL